MLRALERASSGRESRAVRGALGNSTERVILVAHERVARHVAELQLHPAERRGNLHITEI